MRPCPKVVAESPNALKVTLLAAVHRYALPGQLPGTHWQGKIPLAATQQEHEDIPLNAGPVLFPPWPSIDTK